MMTDPSTPHEDAKNARFAGAMLVYGTIAGWLVAVIVHPLISHSLPVENLLTIVGLAAPVAGAVGGFIGGLAAALSFDIYRRRGAKPRGMILVVAVVSTLVVGVWCALSWLIIWNGDWTAVSTGGLLCMVVAVAGGLTGLSARTSRTEWPSRMSG